MLLLSWKLTSAAIAQHKVTTHETFEQEADIGNINGTITWSNEYLETINKNSGFYCQQAWTGYSIPSQIEKIKIIAIE